MFNYGLLDCRIPVCAEGYPLEVCCPGAVSYTHLDVYKRQYIAYTVQIHTNTKLAARAENVFGNNYTINNKIKV